MGYCQSYFDNIPVWKVHSIVPINSNCYEEKQYVYYVNGDSVISGKNYKKLYTRGVSILNNIGIPIPNCSGVTYFNDTTNVFAFLRDTLKSIFIYDQNLQKDTLLYDFDLSIGDTVPKSYNNNNIEVVTSIDSVFIYNTYRYRYAISSNTQSQFIVEAIGHDGGLLEPLVPIFAGQYDLYCYGLNFIEYYPQSSGTCDFTVGISELADEKTFPLVYPNPAVSEITVHIRPQVLKIIIYNNLMQEIRVVNNMLKGELKINISDLGSGVYFIKTIKENDTQDAISKLIKL